MKKQLTMERKIEEALAVAKEMEQAKADVDRMATGESVESPPVPKPPKVPATPADLPLKLAKPCREARSIIQGVAKQMPEAFREVGEVQLLSVHDAAALSRNSGGPERVKGSYARQALVGSSGSILMYGPGETLGSGDYVIAYRFGFLEPVKGGSVCFVDIAVSGVTAVGCRPDGDRFQPKTWTLVPQLLRNDRERAFDYRFGPHGHRVAIDRVYVFKLVPKGM
jgi:hypothetical protein